MIPISDSADLRPAAFHRRSMTSTGTSHRGRVRASNQDAFLEHPELGLWAVADGMGGLASGERASRAVVDGLARLEPGEGLVGRVEVCIAQVNDELRSEAAMSDGGKTMGSTVVVLLADGRNFTCLWAGDSRLYRWRRGTLQQLTRDHTPMQDLLDAGLAPNSYRGLDHIINRAVGTEAVCRLDRIDGTIEPGDLFLLCTDGLSKAIDASQIGSLLGSDIPSRAVQHLIGAALLAGGPDNVTTVIVGEAAAGSVDTSGPADRTIVTDCGLQVPIEPSVDGVPAHQDRATPPRRPLGEWVAWLGMLLALLLGLLSIGLQKTELRLQFAAVDPASMAVAPILDDLSDIEGRMAMDAFAEGFLLIGTLLGLVGRRTPLLALTGAAAIVIGLAAAVVAITDLGDPTVLTDRISLPILPLPVSQLFDTIFRALHPWS